MTSTLWHERLLIVIHQHSISNTKLLLARTDAYITQISNLL